MQVSKLSLLNVEETIVPIEDAIKEIKLLCNYKTKNLKELILSGESIWTSKAIYKLKESKSSNIIGS